MDRSVTHLSRLCVLAALSGCLVVDLEADDMLQTAYDSGYAEGYSARDSEIDDLTSQLADLESQLSALAARMDDVEDTTDAVDTLSGLADHLTLDASQGILYVHGVNLQIVESMSETPTGCDGLGNLILGHNPNDHSYTRDGCHNLVIGSNHGYTASAGIVTGNGNNLSKAGAILLGGEDNEVRGKHSVIIGGESNWIGDNAQSASIIGGQQNTTEGNAHRSVILAGQGNRIGSSAMDAYTVGGAGVVVSDAEDYWLPE